MNQAWREAAQALQQELAASLGAATSTTLGVASDPRAGSVSVSVVERTGSTNTDLLERLRAGERGIHVLAAQRQDAGRGRMGRTWEASAGATLTFSVALPLAPRRGWSGLSIAVGLALAEALQPRGVLTEPAGERGRLMLKWPNDLWWCSTDASGRVLAPERGRKAVGVLVETVAMPPGALPEPAGLRGVVVGVGVNIAPLQVEGVTPGWTRLWCAGDTPPAAWRRSVPALLQALVRFEREGLEGWAESLAARDVLRGQAVRLSTDPERVWVADGIADDGALCVRDPEAPEQQHRVVSGEVSVRPIPGPAPSADA